MRFSPVWGINLIPYTVCKSRLCRRILSRLRADLRENPTKQWASRDTLIQSAGSISNSARYHSDANIALGPILKMYIPGQIRISNALNSDGYSTGNAPPSGNNDWFLYQPHAGTYNTQELPCGIGVAANPGPVKMAIYITSSSWPQGALSPWGPQRARAGRWVPLITNFSLFSFWDAHQHLQWLWLTTDQWYK